MRDDEDESFELFRYNLNCNYCLVRAIVYFLADFLGFLVAFLAAGFLAAFLAAFLAGFFLATFFAGFFAFFTFFGFSTLTSLKQPAPFPVALACLSVPFLSPRLRARRT